MMTIDQHWQSYRRDLIPKDASQVQITETRRAFYAGAWIMHEMSQRLGEPDISIDDGVMIFEALRLEIKAFQEWIGKGN